MATIEWGLVTCPDHLHQGAVLHADPETISAARAGCTACRITLDCPACGWATRHVLWASAISAEAFHQRSCDPTRSSPW